MSMCPYGCGVNHRGAPTPTNCENYPTNDTGRAGGANQQDVSGSLATKSVDQKTPSWLRADLGPFSSSQDSEFENFLDTYPNDYMDRDDLGFEGGGYCHVDTDEDGMTFSVSENMRFHHDRGMDVSLVDDDGDLTQDTQRRLTEFYSERMVKAGVPKNVADSLELEYNPSDDPDERGYDISMRVNREDAEGKTLGQVTEQYLTPLYNDLTNTTDPGSFNNPYVFDSLIGQDRNH